MRVYKGHSQTTSIRWRRKFRWLSWFKVGVVVWSICLLSRALGEKLAHSQYFLNHTPILRKLSKSDCGLRRKKHAIRLQHKVSHGDWIRKIWMKASYRSIAWTSLGNIITLTSTPFSFNSLAYYKFQTSTSNVTIHERKPWH